MFESCDTVRGMKPTEVSLNTDLSNVCPPTSGGWYIIVFYGGEEDVAISLIAMMMVDLSGFESAWHNGKPHFAQLIE